MVTQTELVAALDALSDQVTKVRNEMIAKIAELETALAAAGNIVNPAVERALIALKGTVQATDDVIPDPTTGS